MLELNFTNLFFEYSLCNCRRVLYLNSEITDERVVNSKDVQWYFKRIIIVNKNVDINYTAHDAFLELPLSGTLKIERLENNNLNFGSNKANGSKKD